MFYDNYLENDIYFDINSYKKKPFGNGYGNLIINKDIKKELTNLLTFYNINKKKQCFKNYNNDYEKLLYNDNFLVSYNFNIKPYYLILKKTNNINHAIYYNTYNEEFILVKHRFDDSLFKGETIFEGEMIITNNNIYTFLLYNIIIKNGADISNLPFNIKLNYLNNICYNLYITDDYIEPLNIYVKDFVTHDQLDSFINEFIPSINFHTKINGLWLVPTDNNIIYIYKVKRFTYKSGDVSTNSLEMDCNIYKTNNKDIYNIFNNNIYYGNLLLLNNSIKKQIKKMFKNKSNIKLFCLYSNDNQGWIPKLYC